MDTNDDITFKKPEESSSFQSKVFVFPPEVFKNYGMSLIQSTVVETNTDIKPSPKQKTDIESQSGSIYKKKPSPRKRGRKSAKTRKASSNNARKTIRQKASTLKFKKVIKIRNFEESLKISSQDNKIEKISKDSETDSRMYPLLRGALSRTKSPLDSSKPDSSKNKRKSESKESSMLETSNLLRKSILLSPSFECLNVSESNSTINLNSGTLIPVTLTVLKTAENHKVNEIAKKINECVEMNQTFVNLEGCQGTESETNIRNHSLLQLNNSESDVISNPTKNNSCINTEKFQISENNIEQMTDGEVNENKPNFNIDISEENTNSCQVTKKIIHQVNECSEQPKIQILRTHIIKPSSLKMSVGNCSTENNSSTEPKLCKEIGEINVHNMECTRQAEKSETDYTNIEHVFEEKNESYEPDCSIKMAKAIKMIDPKEYIIYTDLSVDQNKSLIQEVLKSEAVLKLQKDSSPEVIETEEGDNINLSDLNFVSELVNENENTERLLNSLHLKNLLPDLGRNINLSQTVLIHKTDALPSEVEKDLKMFEQILPEEKSGHMEHEPSTCSNINNYAEGDSSFIQSSEEFKLTPIQISPTHEKDDRSLSESILSENLNERNLKCLVRSDYRKPVCNNSSNCDEFNPETADIFSNNHNFANLLAPINDCSGDSKNDIHSIYSSPQKEFSSMSSHSENSQKISKNEGESTIESKTISILAEYLNKAFQRRSEHKRLQNENKLLKGSETNNCRNLRKSENDTQGVEKPGGLVTLKSESRWKNIIKYSNKRSTTQKTDLAKYLLKRQIKSPNNGEKTQTLNIDCDLPSDTQTIYIPILNIDSKFSINSGLAFIDNNMNETFDIQTNEKTLCAPDQVTNDSSFSISSEYKYNENNLENNVDYDTIMSMYSMPGKDNEQEHLNESETIFSAQENVELFQNILFNKSTELMVSTIFGEDILTAEESHNTEDFIELDDLKSEASEIIINTLFSNDQCAFELFDTITDIDDYRDLQCNIEDVDESLTIPNNNTNMQKTPTSEITPQKNYSSKNEDLSKLTNKTSDGKKLITTQLCGTENISENKAKEDVVQTSQEKHSDCFRESPTVTSTIKRRGRPPKASRKLPNLDSIVSLNVDDSSESTYNRTFCANDTNASYNILSKTDIKDDEESISTEDIEIVSTVNTVKVDINKIRRDKASKRILINRRGRPPKVPRNLRNLDPTSSRDDSSASSYNRIRCANGTIDNLLNKTDIKGVKERISTEELEIGNAVNIVKVGINKNKRGKASSRKLLKKSDSNINILIDKLDVKSSIASCTQRESAKKSSILPETVDNRQEEYNEREFELADEECDNTVNNKRSRSSRRQSKVVVSETSLTESPSRNGSRRSSFVTDNTDVLKCGVCYKHIKKTEWNLHSRNEHNYLAWLHGDTPLDLSDRHAVIKHLRGIMILGSPLMCIICNKKWNSPKKFWDHVRRCSNDEKRKEDDTEEVTVTSSEVRCGLCDWQGQEEGWWQHTYTEHDYLAWRVGETPLDLNNSRVVQEHLKLVLQKLSKLTCRKCGTEWKYVKSYLKHFKVCTGIVQDNSAVPDLSNEDTTASIHSTTRDTCSIDNEESASHMLAEESGAEAMRVKCGVCVWQGAEYDWLEHTYVEHHYLAWKEGEHPLDVNNETAVFSHLKALLKRLPYLTCIKCGIERKYAKAYLSHYNNCGSGTASHTTCATIIKQEVEIEFTNDDISVEVSEKCPIKRRTHSSDNDADDEISLKRLKETMDIPVKCAVCDQQVDGLKWHDHLIGHDYMAWMEGEEELSEGKQLERMMTRYGSLTCRICRSQFWSTSGYKYHMKRCEYKSQLTPGCITQRYVRKRDMVLPTSQRPTSDPVKCAVCFEEMPKKLWTKHLENVHYNLAWFEGGVPFDITDFNTAYMILADLMKKKQLVCFYCGESRMSAAGFYSHIIICHKSQEEIDAMKVECPTCNRRYLPYSLAQHMHLHRRTREPKQQAEPVSDSPVSGRRRMAAVAAEANIEKITSVLVKSDTSCSACKFEAYTEEELEKHKTACRGLRLKREHVSDYEEDPDGDNGDLASESDESDSPAESSLSAEDSIRTESEYEEGDEEKSERRSKDSARREGKEVPFERATYYAGIDDAHLRRPFFTEFAENFCRTHLTSGVLFPELRCNKFELVPSDELGRYLPPMTRSCSFARQSNFGAAFKWKQFELFQAEQKYGKHTLFTGGPIIGISFVPPSDRLSCKSSEHYVSFTCHRDANVTGLLCDELHSHPGLIQIWSFGQFGRDEAATFVLGIAHDYGTVWALDWCPSGGWEDKLAEDTGVLRRAGLVVAACSDGGVYIFAVCDPQQLPHNTMPIYKTKPVMELQLCSEGYGRPRHQATAVQWSIQSGHSVVCVGYANGTLALYHLSSESPALRTFRDDVVILHPYYDYNICSTSITSVQIYPSSQEEEVNVGLISVKCGKLMLRASTGAAPVLRRRFFPNGKPFLPYAPVLNLPADDNIIKGLETGWLATPATASRRIADCGPSAACVFSRRAVFVTPETQIVLIRNMYPDSDCVRKNMLATYEMVPLQASDNVELDKLNPYNLDTYEKVIDKFGVLWTPNPKVNPEKKVDRYPLHSITSMAFCPCRGHFNRLAWGGYSGLVYVTTL